MESAVRGGTRWKRFAVVMVPSVAATAAIGVALAQGALAASFSVSGQSFKVKAQELDGTGFAQYGGMAVGTDLEGKKAVHPVAISSFKSAEITNMCQSVVTPLPWGGHITLRLNAGGKGTPVHAENLYLDIEDLDTTGAKFTNIDIGVAAGSTTKGPPLAGGVNKNAFAQQADKALLTNVKQKAWSTTAGTFELSGLSMRLVKGVKECY
ncbi:DUF6230 family protein [Streptomyces sp. H27-C3]|uniref:DUF6230 family protein n=1 Tax=Streptomyces sp. H27-C3 TaxID=3046305 RepID=UPI0024BA15A3|nr:DUF6230 family protein [Streptomyces sp. H27-C3]MDJ0460716.1 DUF6230 family protein [Streptomyces sp. H27-C3]